MARIGISCLHLEAQEFIRLCTSGCMFLNLIQIERYLIKNPNNKIQ